VLYWAVVLLRDGGRRGRVCHEDREDVGVTFAGLSLLGIVLTVLATSYSQHLRAVAERPAPRVGRVAGGCPAVRPTNRQSYFAPSCPAWP